MYMYMYVYMLLVHRYTHKKLDLWRQALQDVQGVGAKISSHVFGGLRFGITGM